MHDGTVTGFCPLLQARMSLSIATQKTCTILMLLSKRRYWKLKFKILLCAPKMSFFMECLNKNPVYAQVYCTFIKKTHLIL